MASSWLLSAACLSTTALAAGPAPCGVSLPVEEVLQRLNAVRAHGKTCHAAGQMTVGAPLVWSEGLANAAMTQSREMAALNRMSHRDSANRNLGERLRAQGYVFASAAENVAVGYTSLDEVVDAWLGSEGHCENLMSGAVIELGLACIDGSDIGLPAERRYWTLVLAAPPKPR
ncbi:MAG: CAP domain-containing protein [Caldimonas sp.]